MKTNETTEAYALAAVGAVEGVYRYYKPELAWGAVIGGIALYDVLCKPGETLCDSFRKQPRALQIAEIALVAGHMLEVIPDKYDPFKRFIDAVK